MHAPKIPAEPSARSAGSAPAPSSRLRADLCRSTTDGVAYSVMFGLADPAWGPFVLAAGLGEINAGLIATAPNLAGTLIALAAPYGLRAFGTHRSWIVFTAALQSLSFVPLAVMAWLEMVPAPLVYIAVTLYWASFLAGGPAWTTWIEAIVPRRISARYFGRRSRLCQFGVVLGLVLGGLLLEREQGQTAAVRAFALLFLAAGLARAVSTYYLWRYSEPLPVSERHRVVGPIEIIRRVRHGPDGRLLTYMVLVQVALQVAMPFFSPFVLVQLQKGYWEYVTLCGAVYVGKAIAQPWMGVFAHRFGAARLLLIAAVLIVPLPGLWLLSGSFWALFGVQLWCGAVIGAYELATFLLILETVKVHERTSLLVTYNMCNAFAGFGGSVVGGILLKSLGKDLWAYEIVFLASIAARLVTLAFLARSGRLGVRVPEGLEEVTEIPPMEAPLLDRPVISSVREGSRAATRHAPPPAPAPPGGPVET